MGQVDVHRQRRHIEFLRRRQRYLAGQMETVRPEELSFVKREHGALEWVLRLAEQHLADLIEGADQPADSASEFDRRGRWRSRAWRDFVRSLACGCGDPRCPNCGHTGGSSRVVAAHLRNQEGMGVRPDDFLVFAASDFIHRLFHQEGHPSVARQLVMVAHALREGFKRGVLKVDPEQRFGLPF